MAYKEQIFKFQMFSTFLFKHLKYIDDFSKKKVCIIIHTIIKFDTREFNLKKKVVMRKKQDKLLLCVTNEK